MEMSTNCSQRVRSFKTKLLNQWFIFHGEDLFYPVCSFMFGYFVNLHIDHLIVFMLFLILTKNKSVICSCHITVTRLLIVSQLKQALFQHCCYSLHLCWCVKYPWGRFLLSCLFIYYVWIFCKSSHRPPYSFYVVPFDFPNLLTCALFSLDTSALFELKTNILCGAVILLSRDYGIDCYSLHVCIFG